MLIALDENVSQEEVARIMSELKKMGCAPYLSRDGKRIACAGVAPSVLEAFSTLESVQEIAQFNTPFKLASRQFQPQDTVIEVGGAKIGGEKNFAVIAGPCAVESMEQLVETARAVKSAGAKLLRGGAFKPRTSPYSFQGLGEEGLRLLAQAREETGLPIVTEAMDTAEVDLVAQYADVIQIGARNMQNYPLLKAVGRKKKPILLKRGMSATVEEFLLAAEYVMAQGNYDVILCERGIKTFETSTRYTLDLSAVPVIQEQSHLPIIIDPSHSTGSRELVAPMCKAALGAGAHGLIVEVHAHPEQALCDSAQSLSTGQFAALMVELKKIAEAVEKTV
jgi:3-deoxy-7-phosphoheptulonate synthase